MPNRPWQVSWLPVRQFPIVVAFHPALHGSGSICNETGNSGATAADLHRFPFSPES